MILVTGATGFVGAHLLYELLKKDVAVKALIRPGSDKEKILNIFRYYTADPDPLFRKINWAEGDISDVQSLEEAFQDVTKVYHTAAFVSFRPGDKKDILRTNITGTANIVNLCLEKNIEKLCFVSSIAAMGLNEDDAPVSEETLWKPTKREPAYSLSKYKSEMEVWRGITEGLKAVIVNPTLIIGPGDWTNGSPAIFSMIAKEFPFYTSGTNGFVDVRDVAEIMAELMESNISGERFILNSENVSYREMFTLIARAMDHKPPKYYARPWQAKLILKLDQIKSFVTFTEPMLSKDLVRIAYKVSRYSNHKIMETIQHRFRTIEESINDTAKIYQKRS